ncbi:hypothetical protein HN954_04225 [bacterium]|nr:hypothetical protein [bacterium]MBT6831910.1 hypothetical protein [bacterium]MBT6996606.1 hypothetical protein [bacterium]MBT7773026.1 hypothetical protein [bacterium]
MTDEHFSSKSDFGVKIPNVRKSRTLVQRAQRDAEHFFGEKSVELSMKFVESNL